MAERTINSLPEEVLDYILALVSPYGDLRNCTLVCRRWRDSVHRVSHNHWLALLKATPEMKLIWSSSSCQSENVVGSQPQQQPQISKRYSHSAVYDDGTLSMFVFGGCTSTSTTFNDLWRLDLTSRRWHRPLAGGTYPTPKACSVLVKYDHEHHMSSSASISSSSERRRSSLFLFGGWTHPSLYPLHQSWKLFNELHRYDIDENQWTQITPASASKPPPMAGHSATVHCQSIIVFGGLQKQRSSIGQFSSSNDVWKFNIKTNCWTLEDIPEPRPQPRYGQSQLFLDEQHILILGGSGGPSNTFNDVWILFMDPAGDWRWIECTVKNAESFGALHMWCHPACRVGDYAVILGKNRTPKAATSPTLSSSSSSSLSLSSSHREARWNVIPQLRRGLNRGYGAIRRHNNPQPNRLSASGADGAAALPRRSLSLDDEPISVRPISGDLLPRQDVVERMSLSSDSEDLPPELEDDDDDSSMDISVEPVTSQNQNLSENSQSSSQVFRSSVVLNIGAQEPTLPPTPQQQPPPRHPGPSTHSSSMTSLASMGGRLPVHVEPLPEPRMQAFASASSSSSGSSFSPGRNQFSAASKKQVETRQRQLDSLRRMEERYRRLPSTSSAAAAAAAAAVASSSSAPTASTSQAAAAANVAGASGGASTASASGAAEKRKPQAAAVDDASYNQGGRCSCQRLSMFVLDISRALNPEHEVEWLPFRSNASMAAPEETILYTLVAGRSELIMFGGIQKDVSTITSGRNATSGEKETVFNDVYFLSPPIHVV